MRMPNPIRPKGEVTLEQEARMMTWAEKHGSDDLRFFAEHEPGYALVLWEQEKYELVTRQLAEEMPGWHLGWDERTSGRKLSAEEVAGYKRIKAGWPDAWLGWTTNSEGVTTPYMCTIWRERHVTRWLV